VEEKKQETMSVMEVAAYSGLDEETIRRMVSIGQIPFVQACGEVRFEKDVIDIWVRLLDCNFYVNITGAGFKQGRGESHSFLF
jgi:excisionase family DNA binding protein